MPVTTLVEAFLAVDIVLFLHIFSKVMFCTCVDGRALVRCGNKGRLALGLDDQATEDFGEGFLAHELFHLCDGDETLFEDVSVTGGGGGCDDSGFVRVLAVAAAFHQLVAIPLFSVVDGGILGICGDFVGPLGQIVQPGENVLNLLISEQRRLCELVLGKEAIFASLDACFEEILAFEADLAEKIKT